ncbi:hypothetical protein Salat_1196700 [Sesamum alatum]|uniref:Myb/SANT-like domain-containing protein n=1 Tax=Sesamum alatum TaxID=300844 RepID=A0AAE1YFB3_9LAMI|nr:hypothetical protein Salat_1196700 [Sesamum alatum]
MADPNPRSQENYFYTSTWTRRHDNTFVQALYNEALRGEVQNLRRINNRSLVNAGSVMKARFGREFKLFVLRRRLLRLQQRYNTFRRILDTPGVVWDVGRNRLEVQNNVWEAICQEDPFANAYFHQGEAQWSRLEIIFGVKVDDPEANGEEGAYVGDDDYSSADGSSSDSEPDPDYMAFLEALLAGQINFSTADSSLSGTSEVVDASSSDEGSN